MKKVIIISVLLLIILSSINARASDPKGDEKIGETKKRIEEEHVCNELKVYNFLGDISDSLLRLFYYILLHS